MQSVRTVRVYYTVTIGGPDPGVQSNKEAQMTRSLIVLALATAAAFSQNLTDKEAVMGAEFAANLDSRVKPLVDPAATALVDRILKAVSQGQALRVPVRLKILDTTEPVASALPGGFLLLSSGAIIRSNTEAEMAALIAHALAHMQPEPAGTVRLFSPWGECWRSGTEALAPRAVLDEARGSETQADTLALDYLAQSHYEVSALTAVFERWGTRFPPDETVKARARSLVAAGAIVNTSEFDKIKARLTLPPARPPTLFPK
jgi:predicted Zn-dependent protease